MNEIPKMVFQLCKKSKDQQVQSGSGAPMVLGGVLKGKKKGIDGLAEMLKCLIENFMRKKRKQLINSGRGHSKCKLEIKVK